MAVYMDEIAKLLDAYMKNETRKWEAKHFATLAAVEEEE